MGVLLKSLTCQVQDHKDWMVINKIKTLVLVKMVITFEAICKILRSHFGAVCQTATKTIWIVFRGNSGFGMMWTTWLGINTITNSRALLWINFYSVVIVHIKYTLLVAVRFEGRWHDISLAQLHSTLVKILCFNWLQLCDSRILKSHHDWKYSMSLLRVFRIVVMIFSVFLLTSFELLSDFLFLAR